MASNIIPVYEIFASIQGEGPDAGRKAVFVRVAGCSFCCPFCDSKYAWDVDNATKMSDSHLVSAILDMCEQHNVSYVVLTGGNPCMYDFTYVIDTLKENSISIAVETQGDIIPAWLALADIIVFSPKAPSAGQPEVSENIIEFIHYCIDIQYPLEFTKTIAIKIPVFSEEDMQFVKQYYTLIRSHYLQEFAKIYISVGNDDTEEQGDISSRLIAKYHTLIDMVMESSMEDIYVLPQLHALVWGNKSGV